MKRHLLLALTAASAIILAGCAAPPHARIEGRIMPAPPAPQAEDVPNPPHLDSYWIPGHWKWNGNAHVWTRGHWEQARASMVFRRAYWSGNNRHWVFHPGRWISIAPQPYEAAPVIIATPPPAPRAETIPAAPAPNHVWASGFWRWSNGRHAWVPGQWEPTRSEYFWAPGHWVKQGSNWTFSGGFWQPHAPATL